MQTRISVYKLYTKSKALYILIYQVASKSFKLQLAKSVLSGVASAGSNRATRVIYEDWRHPDTVDEGKLSSRHLMWRDLFLHQYKAKMHRHTHTHLHKLYTRIHTNIIYNRTHIHTQPQRGTLAPGVPVWTFSLSPGLQCLGEVGAHKHYVSTKVRCFHLPYVMTKLKGKTRLSARWVHLILHVRFLHIQTFCIFIQISISRASISTHHFLPATHAISV